MLTTLTRENFQQELSQLQAHIKTYEDKLTLWKIQERLGNIFLTLQDEQSDEIYVVDGLMKQRMEVSPAYFSLHAAGTVDVVVHRGNVGLVPSSEIRYWTDHPELYLPQDELKRLTAHLDESNGWVKDDLNTDMTTLALDRWRVKASWLIQETNEEITVSLQENQSTIRLPPVSLHDSTVFQRVNQPQGTIPFRSRDSMAGMAKALLTPNSSTAGMGLAERNASLESNELGTEEETGLSVDTKSPEIMQLLARVHGRAIAKTTPMSTQ